MLGPLGNSTVVSRVEVDDVSHGGGRFTFDDGGTYSGGWLEGKAHGYGVCTGPRGQGEYAGAWSHGFETSGTYTWPSGNVYAGQWLDGRRHGVGVETHGRWIYCGEWSAGVKSRYGVRHSTASGSRYEGTWVGGLQDGFGVETYADRSTYQGQWLRGLRHGYGVRQSAPFDDASPFYSSKAATSTVANGKVSNGRSKKQHHKSLPALVSGSGSDDRNRTSTTKSIDDQAERTRSGFALSGPGTSQGFVDAERAAWAAAGADGPPRRRSRSASLRLSISDSFGLQVGGKKNKLQSSASDVSTRVTDADSSISLTTSEDLIETYAGEWRSDKRCGYGISHRSDGLRFAGEWYNDQRCGYGMMAFQDGRTIERGKYRDNVIVKTDLGVSGTRKLFDFRLSKLKSRVEAALLQARKASELASQKAEIATTRRTTAKLKASEAETAARKAMDDSQLAKKHSAEYLHLEDDATPMTTTSPTVPCDATSDVHTQIGEAVGRSTVASLTDRPTQLALPSFANNIQSRSDLPDTRCSGERLCSSTPAERDDDDNSDSHLDYPVYFDSQYEDQPEVVNHNQTPALTIDVVDRVAPKVSKPCSSPPPIYASVSSHVAATPPRRGLTAIPLRFIEPLNAVVGVGVESVRHADSHLWASCHRLVNTKSSSTDFSDGSTAPGVDGTVSVSTGSTTLPEVRTTLCGTPKKTDRTVFDSSIPAVSVTVNQSAEQSERHRQEADKPSTGTTWSPQRSATFDSGLRQRHHPVISLGHPSSTSTVTMPSVDAVASVSFECNDTEQPANEDTNHLSADADDRRVSPSAVSSASDVSRGLLPVGDGRETPANVLVTSLDTTSASTSDCSSRQTTQLLGLTDIMFIDNDDDVIDTPDTSRCNNAEIRPSEHAASAVRVTGLGSRSCLTPSSLASRSPVIRDVVRAASARVSEFDRSPAGRRPRRPRRYQELLVEITDIDAVEVIPDDAGLGRRHDESSSSRLNKQFSSLSCVEPSSATDSNPFPLAPATPVESTCHATDFSADRSPGFNGDRDKHISNASRRRPVSPAHLTGTTVFESSIPAVPDTVDRSADQSESHRQEVDRLSTGTTRSPQSSATFDSGLRQRHHPVISLGHPSFNSTVTNPIAPIPVTEELDKSDAPLITRVTHSESSNVLSDCVRREGVPSEQRQADDNSLLVDEILDWCDRNPITVLFLVLNILLAAIIYKLLASHLHPSR